MARLDLGGERRALDDGSMEESVLKGHLINLAFDLGRPIDAARISQDIFTLEEAIDVLEAA
jgi:hypothetical protein